MPGGGPAFLRIFFCEDAELSRLAARVIHQAFRNGARQVYVRDGAAAGDCGRQERDGAAAGDCGRQERGGAAGGRLAAGQKYGYYRLREASGAAPVQKPWLEAVFEGASRPGGEHEPDV